MGDNPLTRIWVMLLIKGSKRSQEVYDANKYHVHRLTKLFLRYLQQNAAKEEVPGFLPLRLAF